jgi:spermidine synthase
VRVLVFVLFLVSGAASLVYEVAWVRSLGLVFGASHLAVTTVLAVFMGGQALGSRLFGPRADLTDRPLRLYGVLELGIAASALASFALVRAFPVLYGPLARVAETNVPWLTFLRVTFAVFAIAIPTTLMGGTLPVLTRYVVRRGEALGTQLSFLYAFNTFGAVVGTMLAGFVLLRTLGVTMTFVVAAGVSAAVGTAAILLGRTPGPAVASAVRAAAGSRARSAPEGANALARKIAVIGVGVSGFCALGYEVLWTRMLTLVVGTSVYSFTIMLAAFLAGIAIGSEAFGLLRAWRAARPDGRGGVLVFAGTQLAIGASALAVTVLINHLPSAANRLQALLIGGAEAEFGGRLLASGVIAFLYVFVPAFFMGMAFPAAGAIWTAADDDAGGTVGRLLSSNTIGAILGSSLTGFVLVYLFGIERSLHMLVVANVAMGLAIAAALAPRPRLAFGAIAAAAASLLVARGAFEGWGRAWDRDYFAAVTNNTRMMETPESIRRKNLEVLYYHEGVDETVSSVRGKGSVQTFIVNGRPEASTGLADVQVQRALGHLPMLLHPDPRRVFVLGTGTGMTLGAVAAHPEAQRIVLGEIEEAMLGVARTFEPWNGHVLDDPRLRVVFNDGRNFLSTTRERFDVITADPIHPWSGGAGYLYTREYFRSVSDRLAPGGIACQWLPMYELTIKDVRTVVRTFADTFQNVVVWLTYHDAVLIGSQAPIVVDEAALARRLATPAIRDGLAPVRMATADDFLSYFLMGSDGARAFGAGGALNADDNLVLEFSAPASQGKGGLDGANIRALSRHRESLYPLLAPAATPEQDASRRARWERHLETSRLFDQAHAEFLEGRRHSPLATSILDLIQARDPTYAPLLFLLGERDFWDRTEPALVAHVPFRVLTAGGQQGAFRISAVRQFLGRERVLVSFVDNARREIYGQRYVDGPYEQLDADVARFVSETASALSAAAARVQRDPLVPPRESELVPALKEEARRVVGVIPDAAP